MKRQITPIAVTEYYEDGTNITITRNTTPSDGEEYGHDITVQRYGIDTGSIFVERDTDLMLLYTALSDYIKLWDIDGGDPSDLEEEDEEEDENEGSNL